MIKFLSRLDNADDEFVDVYMYLRTYVGNHINFKNKSLC